MYFPMKQAKESPTLQVYTFESAKVRTVSINGQPWFVAADVCRCLGLAIGVHSAGHYLKGLHEDEVTRQRLAGKGMSGAKLISESGLYKLIMRSDKPEARRFQDWVTRDVLPAIRKDGAYVVGEEKVKTGEMTEDELVLRAMTALKSKVERLTSETKGLKVEKEVLIETNSKLLLENTTLKNAAGGPKELTVARFCALHILTRYARFQDKCALGKLARKLAVEKGLTLKSEVKEIEQPWGTKTVSVWVYPTAILKEAAAALGLN